MTPVSTRSNEIRIHQEWLGYLQPVGLVVAPSALVDAGVYPDREAARRQQELVALVEQDADERCFIPDFPRFTRELLGWQPSDLVPGDALPDGLTAPLPEYGETLRPTWAVPDPEAIGRTLPGAWLLLGQDLPTGTALDSVPDDRRPDGSRHVGLGAGTSAHHGWRATPQARFERLLREAGVPAGVLTNGHEIRLVYAPRGESSGHLTFRVDDLLTPAGRPMLGALVMLLGAECLFSVPTHQRLGALLRQSRAHQNTVSTALADQVLGALYELTAGFQAADELRGGTLLGEALRESPQDVYGGLLTTLLRLVFVLYAEDRALLPGDALYQQYYSVGGLFERLREDAARYPDTMDQRYGAWAQLLALFRMLHDGARSDRFYLPPRHGHLFDPDAYPFLEGRPFGTRRVMGERTDPPRVSDGCLYRVLERLLMLDGERLSYRALDVEQIGSVYEAIMGFELVVVRGTSVAVKPKTKKPGSASHLVVDLDALLTIRGAERAKSLKETADCELSSTQAKSLAAAGSTEALVGALGGRVSPFTPRPVPRGAMLLSPTEERRRSGSHYTPRALTEPIVRTTLAPLLAALGVDPHPAQLLALRVCDPAMGSGAFLVEACRQLGDALVTAWQRHGETPELPPDEDAGLAARRLVAQRCLYGVDRNPFAVDLAKLSLWLVTLAREHPFTFVDHALRQGDSLVGFSRRQVAAFHWGQHAAMQTTFIGQHVEERLDEARKARHVIEALGDSDDVRAKTRMLRDADAALGDVRLTGDALAAAFFGATKPKQRAERLADFKALVLGWLDGTRARSDVEQVVAALRGGERPVTPFHWELEFPEVFDRKNPGFDAFVGNPPFAGKNTIIAANAAEYLPFLQTVHPESHGNADLVAHFFRRAYTLLREGGAFGLIATNTIAQGDTRSTGLRWLCTHDCTLYEARTRYRWPGHAAVVVSVVHGRKGAHPGPYRLDGRPVERITAFLFHDGGHEDPNPLAENAGRSFQGSIVLGMGFTFDDANPDEATPLAEMHRLIAADARNAERIFPYIGGEEVNDSPTHAHRRYVINFGEMGEEEARRGWPELMRIVEERVRPARLAQKRDIRSRYWWRFGETTPALFEAVRPLDCVLANSQVSAHHAFAFSPTDRVFAHTLNVFTLDSHSAFAVLQSRAHEGWARFLGSSMKDDTRYTPSDCFETFPFPPGWRADSALEAAGRAYYDHRAALMVAANEGLTKTYNRFHDPDERAPAILRLRELHAELDRTVLAAYGWTDLDLRCEFLLDWEDDEEVEGGAGVRRRKKPYRLRWPDPVRDEVLARLLALNRRRAAGVGDEVAERFPRRGDPTASAFDAVGGA